MKATTSYLLLILCLSTQGSLAQTPFRFEAELGVSSLQLPHPYRSGWHVRQQLTAYVHPRLGIALGVGWGGSANNDPLGTPRNKYGQPDSRALLDFYNRQEQMTELSAVWLPFFTRQHQLKLQVGLSLQRRREVAIDSIFRERPATDDFYEALPTYTDQSRVVPMAAVGYDFRLSPRWALGVNAVTYPSNEKMTTLGLRTTYRFNVSRDSLGINSGTTEPLAWGVRLAVNRVGENGSSSAAFHNVTRAVAGLWADYPLSLTWSMRGELIYAQRGYQFDGQTAASLITYGRRVEATYLEVPLLFRHEAAERWHLYAGPYLAFLLNGTSHSDGQPTQTARPHTNSGMMLGAEYQLIRKLSVDLRYQRDLIQLSTTPYSTGYHSYQLGLNWQLRN